MIARLPLVGRSQPGWRDRRVQELVAYAYRRVPYYRRLFDAHGVRPERIRGVADLTLVPTTTRGELARLHSGGPAASGLAASRAWLEQRRLAAARAYALEGAGLRRDERLVCIGAGESAAPRERRVLGCLLDAVGLPLEQTLADFGRPDETAARLAAVGADVVLGSGSTLAPIADAFDRRADVRLVLSGCDPLTPALRDRLQRGFGAPVREIYCSPEFGVMACECPAGGPLHTCDDGMVLEVLEPDDRPAAPGRVGEIVGTNLHAFGVPLIRVRTGDHASLARECGCGGTNGTIDNLVRRPRQGERPRAQTEAGGESPRVA